MESNTRGTWGSRLGFILAATGSAIGLGNIWRYPYVAGQNGGAAFVLMYLACVLAIGIPVLIAELSMGRHTNLNPVGAFKKISRSRAWPLVGYLGVATGVFILSFYAVIAGWTIAFIFRTLLHTPTSFDDFLANPYSQIGYFALFLGLTLFVVLGGVERGIERWSKILMPMLLVILFGLIAFSLTLPGASAGVEFYLKPDFSKITGSTILAALGQAFFSLSLGMGTMITYGSYLSKKENVVTSGVAVGFSDTLIAVLAGLVIFPALFSAGLEPTQGPGLVFNVLPTIFEQMPAGTLIGVLFFVLLAIAALTSTVSLLEVPVAFLVDQKGWSRAKAVWILSGLVLVVGIPSALSFGAVAELTSLEVFGQTGFLNMMNFLFGDVSLPVGGFFLAIFVGWIWTTSKASDELSIAAESSNRLLLNAWGILLRFVCPVVILVVLGQKLFGF